MSEPLEWLFKITDQMSGPAERISNALDKTEKSLKHAEHATTAYEKAAEKAEEQSKDLLKELLKFGGIGLGIEAIAGLFEKVGELAKEAVHKVFELGEETIKAAAKAQRSEASFKLLLGEEGGETALQYIEKIQNHTELTGAELKSVAQQFIAVGMKGEDLTKALPAALDVGAFFGGGIGNVQAAASALSRISMSGKVEGRALRALGLDERDVLPRIAAIAGMSQDAVVSAMSAGKLKSSTVLEGVYQSIAAKEKGVLGTAGVEASATVEGQLHRLADLPEKFMERLSKSEGFAKFGGFLGKLLETLDPDSPFGQQVMKRIEGMFNRIMEVFGGADQADVFEGIKGGIMGILDAFDGFIPTIKSAMDWVKDFIKSLRGLSLMFEGLKVDQEELSAAWSFYTSGGKDASGMVTAAAHRLEHNAHVNDFYGIGKDMADGVAKGMGDGSKALADAGEGAADSVEKAVRDKTKTHSPSLLFADIGYGFAQGLAQGIEEGAGDVDRAAVNSLIPNAGGAGGQRFAFGDIVINIEGGGTADEMGAAAAQKLAMVIASHVEGAFEQLATEQGVDQ
jgi:tape measure domain-containing protein